MRQFAMSSSLIDEISSCTAKLAMTSNCWFAFLPQPDSGVSSATGPVPFDSQYVDENAQGEGSEQGNPMMQLLLVWENMLLWQP